MTRSLADNRPIISVIVPIYNTKMYLSKCIDSIMSQQYKNLEIILVDDGSTDESGIICDKYSCKDRRIKVIHKENGGLQSARVTGIDVATGEYIGFVDSDDWIDDDHFSYLYEESRDVDIVTSAIRTCDEKGILIDRSYDAISPGIYDSNEGYFINNLVIGPAHNEKSDIGGIMNSVCTKIYSAKILKRINYNIDHGIRRGEDFYLTLLAVINSKKIRITDHISYNYRVHDNSMTNNFSDTDFAVDMIRLHKAVSKAISGHAYENILEAQWENRLMYYFLSQMRECMGFRKEAQFPFLEFPEERVIFGRRVVVFGTGMVGRSFIFHWKMRRTCDIVLVIDNDDSIDCNIYGYKPQKPDTIIDVDYDYIVCAVNNEQVAKDMIKQLDEYGVNKEKILWSEPINSCKYYYFGRII